MLREEFDNQFDVLYNNITSNQAPGLNTYEKSIFLTKGQDEVLKNYFNPKGNKYQEGFDDNAKRQIDFSNLTTVYEYPASNEDTFGDALFDPRENSKKVPMPTDDKVMMIINERAEVTRNNVNNVPLMVVPISFDEYNRLMSKPFKRPLKHQAWRLINNSESNYFDVVVGPGDTITKYIVRYIRQPKPIILGNIEDLSINGYKWKNAPDVDDNEEPVIESGYIYGDNVCELDPIIHEEILQRAVELAKTAWTATGQDNIQAVMQAGQRSE